MSCSRCHDRRHYLVDGVWKPCDCLVEARRQETLRSTNIPISYMQGPHPGPPLPSEYTEFIHRAKEALAQNRLPKVNVVLFCRDSESMYRAVSVLFRTVLEHNKTALLIEHIDVPNTFIGANADPSTSDNTDFLALEIDLAQIKSPGWGSVLRTIVNRRFEAELHTTLVLLGTKVELERRVESLSSLLAGTKYRVFSV